MQPVNRIDAILSLSAGFDMPRPRKEPRAALGTDLPPDLLEELREYSLTSGIPINRLVEDAVRMLLTARYWFGEKDEDRDRSRD